MKNFLSLNKLSEIGATNISLITTNSLPNGLSIPLPVAITPGFYFFVSGGIVQARYFVGNRRSKQGIRERITRIWNPRSENDVELNAIMHKYGLWLYFVPYEKTKHLTYEYSQLRMVFSKPHKSEAQTYSEINRMLNDRFLWGCQKY